VSVDSVTRELGTMVTMPGRRGTARVVAVSCVALIVFAAFLPLGAMSLEWLAVTPAFTLLLPLATLVAPPEAPGCDEQPVALHSTFESRGPPAHSSIA
jgi:hypothetical protein